MKTRAVKALDYCKNANGLVHVLTVANRIVIALSDLSFVQIKHLTSSRLDQCLLRRSPILNLGRPSSVSLTLNRLLILLSSALIRCQWKRHKYKTDCYFQLNQIQGEYDLTFDEAIAEYLPLFDEKLSFLRVALFSKTLCPHEPWTIG